MDSSGENVSISEYDLDERRNDSFYKVQKPSKQPQKLPAHIQLPKKMNMPSLHHWID
jgi:ABC-type multidrug transport system fused ATPase/permease subunit